MANIILTRSCSKKCSYCFANTYTGDEMSIDMFASILENKDIEEVKLLGGEPTQHTKFSEILKICEEKNVYVVLISNFLFSENIRNLLIQHINKRPNKFSFLINSTDLNVLNRMLIFKENYNLIYEEAYKFDSEIEIACGITIDENKTVEEYIEYIDYLISNLTAIEEMRLSLRFPGDEDKNNFYFINNNKLGDMFIFIIKKLMNENIPVHLDCIHFPCMYSSKEEIKFVKKFMKGSEKFSCNSICPADYLPDGKVIYCFPNSDISLNSSEYKKNTEIRDALKEKYLEKISKIILPELCLKCTYRNICNGPCPGFFQLNQIPAGFDGHNEEIFDYVKNNNIYENNDSLISWNKCYKFIANAIDRNGTFFDSSCGDAAIIKSFSLWSGYNLIPYGVDCNLEKIQKAKELYPEYKENLFFDDFRTFDIKNITQVDYGYFAAFVNFDFIDKESIDWIVKLSSIVKYRLIIAMHGDFEFLGKDHGVNNCLSDEYVNAKINNISNILSSDWNKKPIKIQGSVKKGYDAFYFERL